MNIIWHFEDNIKCKNLKVRIMLVAGMVNARLGHQDRPAR